MYWLADWKSAYFTLTRQIIHMSHERRCLSPSLTVHNRSTVHSVTLNNTTCRFLSLSLCHTHTHTYTHMHWGRTADNSHWIISELLHPSLRFTQPSPSASVHPSILSVSSCIQPPTFTFRLNFFHICACTVCAIQDGPLGSDPGRVYALIPPSDWHVRVWA